MSSRGVAATGISRIEYRPWEGKRTNPNQRLLVISRAMFLKNVKAKSVLVILIVGILLAHMLPILFAVFTPHESLTADDMVGEDPNVPKEAAFRTDGFLMVNETLIINGTFQVDGFVQFRAFDTDGFFLDGTISGDGTVINGQHDGNLGISGSLNLDGVLVVKGNFSGKGHLWGGGMMVGTGNVTGWGEKPQEESGGYFTMGLFAIFSMILAAIICADIVSADLADSSFVLYFSRPVRAIDYLVGKFVGLSWVMGLFTVIPPILYVLVMMGTQTGKDYWSGVEMLGLAVVAGIVTALYFLPYGLMISSLTKRKAYAGIGIFMSFFVLSIISEIFSQWNEKWILIDPFAMLHAFYTFLFGHSMTVDISGAEVAASMLVMMVAPLVIVYLLIQRKGAGK